MNEPSGSPATQPVGEPLPAWTARALPPSSPMSGSYCRVEPLDPARHASALFDANSEDAAGANWTYLPIDAPQGLDAYSQWLSSMSGRDDPMFHAIIDTASGQAVGLAAYLRIDRQAGSIEVGHINFSPRLQRTRMATEAMYLMMRRAFDELGYRRYEWKCDSHNAPSRAAAARYGFRLEGIFRQALVYKQRNRDTVWFSILDKEWPPIRQAFESWLALENFDAAGSQVRSLGSFMIARNGEIGR
jgi:RimJ/RimL family protein N-acetyltransferase